MSQLNIQFKLPFSIWQLSIAFIYASGRYQVEKHSYMYGHDAFVADFGGYLVKCLLMLKS